MTIKIRSAEELYYVAGVTGNDRHYNEYTTGGCSRVTTAERSLFCTHHVKLRFFFFLTLSALSTHLRCSALPPLFSYTSELAKLALVRESQTGLWWKRP